MKETAFKACVALLGINILLPILGMFLFPGVEVGSSSMLITAAGFLALPVVFIIFLISFFINSKRNTLIEDKLNFPKKDQ